MKKYLSVAEYSKLTGLARSVIHLKCRLGQLKYKMIYPKKIKGILVENKIKKLC